MAEAQAEGRYHVLLAEDDESIRSTLQSLLQMKGHTVSIAQDASETQALLAAGEYDLIISDYLMPGGGGRELLRYLEGVTPHPAVIMITGLADEQLFSDLMAQGVDRCLSKPFRLASLLATIEEVMAQHQSG